MSEEIILPTEELQELLDNPQEEAVPETSMSLIRKLKLEN
jgi:hypothetical protein